MLHKLVASSTWLEIYLGSVYTWFEWTHSVIQRREMLYFLNMRMMVQLFRLSFQEDIHYTFLFAWKETEIAMWQEREREVKIQCTFSPLVIAGQPQCELCVCQVVAIKHTAIQADLVLHIKPLSVSCLSFIFSAQMDNEVPGTTESLSVYSPICFIC